jgi:hypothetical protein
VAAPRDLTGALRELHDDYVWQVNAAIEEGREDLVGKLVEQYLDDAMRTMTQAYAPPCDRPGRPACTRPESAGQPRRGWLRRLFG